MKKNSLIKQCFILLFLLTTSACTTIGIQKKPEPIHPVVGKWAQPGKCNSFPWVFGTHSVKWGDNGGSWTDLGNKIKVTSFIAREGATMILYFSLPRKNTMRTLSIKYGGANIAGAGGKLVKC